MAEKFKKPVVCLIDTPGAFPGLEAEERGQGEAIIQVESINGRDPGIVRDRIPFHHLTPLFPYEKFNLLGNGHNNVSIRYGSDIA